MNLKNLKKSSPLTTSSKTDNIPSATKNIDIVDKKPLLNFTLSKKDPKKPLDGKKSTESAKIKKPLSIFKKILVILLVLILIAGSVGGYLYYQRVNSIKDTGLENVGILDPFKYVASAIDPNANKKAIDDLDQTDGRTNLLALGVDARSGFSSLLTDSIIVMSYDHATNRIVEFSIPRDVMAPYNGRYDKINSVFPYSFSNARNQKKTNDEAIKFGFENLSKAIFEITNIKIHYGIMINFHGLKDIVDKVGGITVNVDRSFTDYTYPNDNDTGVITVSFKTGEQSMNGTRALQYARSRHSLDNGEGSDFMRARRQQKVISAIREKIVSSNLVSQADSLNGIVDAVSANVRFYKVSSDDINKVISSKDLIKTVQTVGFVTDPSIGSYVNQILIGGTGVCDNLPGYYVCPTKGIGKNDDLKEIVGFYFNNPDFLQEAAGVKLLWTKQANRSKDYYKVKNALFAKFMPIKFSDGAVDSPKPTPSTSPTDSASTETQTPTPTTEPKFVTIYTDLNSPKPSTLSIYEKILTDAGITYQEKPAEQMSPALTKIMKDYQILLVIE